MSLDRRLTRRVYNTPVGGSWDFKLHRLKLESEDGDVLRCPECSAEIDVDEDEVEEGEILSCPECECELEVSQTHPVALNPISDDIDEEDDEEEDDKEDAEDDDEVDENGDLLEDEDDEDEAEDEDE
jgi:alpha-aminoadipate/glutamate carrier protein LysW